MSYLTCPFRFNIMCLKSKKNIGLILYLQWIKLQVFDLFKCVTLPETFYLALIVITLRLADEEPGIQWREVRGSC